LGADVEAGVVGAAVEVVDVVVVVVEVVVVTGVVVAAEPDWYILMVQTPLSHQQWADAAKNDNSPTTRSIPSWTRLVAFALVYLGSCVGIQSLVTETFITAVHQRHFPNCKMTHFSTPAIANPLALQVSTHFLMVIAESMNLYAARTRGAESE